MDEFSEKLAGILNDPESMDKVRRMAENLLGSDEKQEPQQQNPDILSMLDGSAPDADSIKKIMNIMSLIRSRGDDKRAALLAALRPHLSEPRQEKLDTAIKILKIIDLLPLIKDSGLLNI